MQPGNLRRAARRQRTFVIALSACALWRITTIPRSFGNIGALAPELCHCQAYLVAFILFLAESVLYIFGWWHLDKVQLKGQGVLVAWLKRLREGLWCGFYVSIGSAFFYLSSYFFEFSPHVGTVNSEVRLMGHYIVWAVSMPMQWVIFINFFSSADSLQITRLLLATAAIPVTGHWASDAAANDRPLESYIAWSIGTWAMLSAFKYAMALPLEPAMGSTARNIRTWMLFVWTFYPVAHLGRQFGYISSYSEQVLLYTVLDICSKTGTLSAMVCTQVLRMIFFCVQEADLQQENTNLIPRNLILTMSVDSWRVASARNKCSSNLAATTTMSSLQTMLSTQPPLESGGLIGMALEELLPVPAQVALLKGACSSERNLCIGSKKPVTVVAERDLQGSHSTFRCTLGCQIRENQLLEIEIIMGANAAPWPGDAATSQRMPEQSPGLQRPP